MTVDGLVCIGLQLTGIHKIDLAAKGSRVSRFTVEGFGFRI